MDMAKKFCPDCGSPMPKDARFCPDCGAAQGTAAVTDTAQPAQQPDTVPVSEVSSGEVSGSEVQQPAKPAPASPVRESSQTEILQAGGLADRLSKMAYLGASLLAVTVFAPLFSVIGLVKVTAFDVSKLFALALLAACGMAARAVSRQDYQLPVIIGNGCILLFLGGFVKYQLAMAEARKSFFGALAGAAVSVEWGTYLFLGGSLLLAVGALGCIMLAKGMPQQAENYFSEWKNITLSQLQLGSVKMAGIVWSVLLAGIFALLLWEAQMGKSLGL